MLSKKRVNAMVINKYLELFKIGVAPERMAFRKEMEDE